MPANPSDLAQLLSPQPLSQMIDDDQFLPPDHGILRRTARDLILNWCLGSMWVPGLLRMAALRALGMSLGPSTTIQPGCWFSGRDVSVGRDCFINYHCQFDEYAPITIGDGVELGIGVLLMTSTHEIGGPEHRCGARVVAPISIEAGSWVGSRATVLSGVTIGSGCLIAAGAVVVHDCEPNGLYGGVPARRIRDL